MPGVDVLSAQRSCRGAILCLPPPTSTDPAAHCTPPIATGPYYEMSSNDTRTLLQLQGPTTEKYLKMLSAWCEVLAFLRAGARNMATRCAAEPVHKSTLDFAVCLNNAQRSGCSLIDVVQRRRCNMNQLVLVSSVHFLNECGSRLLFLRCRVFVFRFAENGDFRRVCCRGLLKKITFNLLSGHYCTPARAVTTPPEKCDQTHALRE